jgi:hypothetical protein
MSSAENAGTTRPTTRQTTEDDLTAGPAGEELISGAGIGGSHTSDTDMAAVPDSSVQDGITADPGLGTRPTADVPPATQLLGAAERETIIGRWREIQAEFVDEPRAAVQDADALVTDLIERLSRAFASELDQLESRWASGENVSTEDLRRGLQRYRSFFERLLAA